MITCLKNRTARTSQRLIVICLIATVTVGCKKGESGGSDADPSNTPQAEQPPKELVSFPPDFTCDDPDVPEFLKSAVKACVDQDYQLFRSMWSAKEEPISEKEFIRAWRANPRFALNEMRRMKTPEGEIVYAVRAHVSLDPNEVPEPERDVVLLIVNESDQWRLRKAPKKLAKLMKGELDKNKDGDANTNGG
ncbi:MAG: hypothetical protein DHS20C16_18810 [Phycisphaerae bacterium]|nr:MAG: hypothetical protein DHS20C16_18810 [Phycisphaerae bacterium]